MENNLIRTEGFLVKRINALDEAIDKKISQINESALILNYNFTEGIMKSETDYESLDNLHDCICNLEGLRGVYVEELELLRKN